MKESEQVRVIRVFVSSPSDVKNERAVLSEVINAINRTEGRSERIRLELFRWEDDVSPQSGPSPQEAIDDQAPTYDIYLGIMSTRFGTPSGCYGSGTEAEFRDALKNWQQEGKPWIAFYFDAQPKLSGDPEQARQYVKVCEFQEELRHFGIVANYYGVRGSADGFFEKVSTHLRQIIVRLQQPGKAMDHAPDISRWLADWERHHSTQWLSEWAEVCTTASTGEVKTWNSGALNYMSAFPSSGHNIHASSAASDKPLYIHDQRWNLLVETSNPRAYLNPDYFRARRDAYPQPQSVDDAWLWIQNRDDFIFDRLQDPQGKAISLNHVVITTDAGVGKSSAIDWLQYRLNQPDTQQFACKLTFAELSGLDLNSLGAHLVRRMAVLWRAATAEKLDLRTAELYVETLRDRGNLTLLIDGLDQSVGSPWFLNWLLRTPSWRSVRIIIGGRPHALSRHWSECFTKEPWRFVQVEEFDEDQQQRYLGMDNLGVPRLESIPKEARAILSVPRVITYMRTIIDRPSHPIRTSADVYSLAIDHMIVKGMEGAEGARLIGQVGVEPARSVNDDAIRTAWEMLGIIAFQTLIAYHRDVEHDSPPSHPDSSPPEYNDSISAGEFNQFRKRLAVACQEHQLLGSMQNNLTGLGWLNTIVERGIFDVDREGIDQVQFANRSLHEFLVAYYLSQNATPDDRRRLWDWIYIKDQPDTDAYYHIWQFLCEMPEERRHAETWLHSIEVLFRPAIRSESQIGNVYYSKRSTEMIYRSWLTLSSYCDRGPRSIRQMANEIRHKWWSEFEQTLEGNHGEERKLVAEEFVADLLVLPAGEYRMGTSLKNQQPSDEWKRRWQVLIDRSQGDRLVAEEIVDRNVRFTGRHGESQRREMIELFVAGDLDSVATRYYAADETPVQPTTRSVGSFALGRGPLRNGSFRLFDPTHGLRPSPLWGDEYKCRSGTPHHPGIFLSWYDAAVFCLWSRWAGESCALPSEEQWEYAAKLGGMKWSQRFWWGDEPNPNKCNVTDSGNGATTVPTPDHASEFSRRLDVHHGIGLMDLLGNVWEWCCDIYRREYVREPTDTPGNAAAVRVCRGGSYNNSASYARCSLRDWYGPSVALNDIGVRVSRKAHL